MGSAMSIRGNALERDALIGSAATKFLGAMHDAPILVDTAAADSDGNAAEGKRNFLSDMLIYAVSHCVPFESGGTVYIYLWHVIAPV